MHKKIIPVFMLIATLTLSWTVPVYASEEYVSTGSFFNWAASGGSFIQKMIGYTIGKVCPSSPDTYHHASQFTQKNDLGCFLCICDYCRQEFIGYESDIEQSYKAQVSDLPATGVDSDGYLYWVPKFSWGRYGYNSLTTSFKYSFYWGNNNTESTFRTCDLTIESEFDPVVFVVYPAVNSSYVDWSGRLQIYCDDVAPVDGYYYCSSLPISGYYLYDETRFDLSSCNLNFPPAYDESGKFYSVGSDFYESFESAYTFGTSGVDFNYGYICYEFVPVKIKPLSGLIDPVSDTTYNIDSRPTSITGDYGIIGDNGQITKVNTTTIINETNNTYTNPSTGTTSTITEWTYDYSDRSYNVTLESGDTVTVTYGDENVTIQEGDTVYNIYYIVESTGEDPGATPSPEACPHSYDSTIDREATCTVPGQMTYTCSLCGHTYTEAIPAKGHIWTVLQTVTTEYDEEGNLIQQGYTLYQCSVCGEQYKDENGTGPPDSGGGGSSDGESIWDKLGEFLGTIFGGLISVIGAFLGAILDALTSLAAMIGEKLTTVVELVLRMFTEIPLLFTGFLGFLTAVFPFLPEDVMLLLTFGIAMIVFIGIIKALRR